MRTRGNMKTRIIFVLILLVIIITTVIIIKNTKEENTTQEEFVKVEQDGTKVNTSNKLKEQKEVDGLIIKDLQIETKNNETLLTATVENPTNTVKGDYSITIKIKNKEGNVIEEIGGYINTTNPKEETNLRTKTSYDFANAYDLEIVKD